MYNRGTESPPSMNVLCQAVEVIECAVDMAQAEMTYVLYAHTNNASTEDNNDVKKSPAKNRRGKRGCVDEREKVYACDLCGRRFTRKDNLQVHESTHTGAKPYECQVCFKRFTRKGNMLTHMYTHTSERQYECQTCLKKFTTKDNLSRHMNTHYDVRLYVCDICSRKFAEKATLTKHMVTHTDERLYECSVCLKRYKTKATLTRHMRTHEAGEIEPNEFITNICQQDFDVL